MTLKCWFCHLAREDKDFLLEDDDFLAKLDAAPATKGHAIIIPKKHITSIFELENDLFENLFNFIKQVKNIIEEKFHPDGYNIGINECQAAGQSINHLHIHLIPRYVGDVNNPKGGVRNILEKHVPPAAPPKDFAK